MTIDFKDKVAIVTGAGGGLGRSHALELSKRGTCVSSKTQICHVEDTSVS